MSNESATILELIDLNKRLLASIAEADWATYQELCDPTLTAFEPESRGNLVEGMDFHHFYFELGGASHYNNSLCAPHVRLMGDVAVVSHVRLSQRLDDAGKPFTARCEETRVWQKRDGKWRHVHFHRSVTS